MPALWRVMLALTIGALTHLGWDACTHANYGLGLYLPVLGKSLFRLGSTAFSMANLLQYVSSVAGLFFLAMAARPARKHLVHGLRTGVPVSWLVTSSVLIAVLTASLTFALSWNAGDGIGQWRHTIRLTAWNGLSAPLLMVALYPWIWRMRQRKAIDRQLA